MTAPAITTPFPAGPAPALPDAPPLADELNSPVPGPTLAGAALGESVKPAEGAPEVPDAPPMTPEQIIGLVAEVSAFGLPQELAQAYKDDFKGNPLVALGVQFSGLADALAAYGLTGAGGKMPEWLSVSLGIAVLGYGVYSTRSKYVPAAVPSPAEEGAAGGFAGAGFDPVVSSADFGFAGSGEGSGG